MHDDDRLVPLDFGRYTVPPIFAYHHLQRVGIPARHNAATDAYGTTTLFVPRSQLERAHAALAQMQADFDAANDEEDAQRGAVSLTDPADAGGALEIAMEGGDDIDAAADEGERG